MNEPLEHYIVDGLLEAVVRCLRSAVGVEAVVAANSGSTIHPQTIAVALDFHGDVRGPVTWVFPRSIALELVRRLTDDPDPCPDTAIGGATELANILTGWMNAALETLGFTCEIGVPRVHVGALPDGVVVRMTTPKGPIYVVLSMSAPRPSAHHLPGVAVVQSRAAYHARR